MAGSSNKRRRPASRPRPRRVFKPNKDWREYSAADIEEAKAEVMRLLAECAEVKTIQEEAFQREQAAMDALKVLPHAHDLQRYTGGTRCEICNEQPFR